MNALRESYILNENQNTYNSLFSKVLMYGNKKCQNKNHLNEAQFNYLFNIKFNLEEQQAAKDLFSIIEYEYFKDRPLNEGADLTVIRQFFTKIKNTTISSVQQFLDMLTKLFVNIKESASEFFYKVFNFKELEQAQVNPEIAKAMKDCSAADQAIASVLFNATQATLKNKELSQVARQVYTQAHNDAKKLDENKFTDFVDNHIANIPVIGNVFFGFRDKEGVIQGKKLNILVSIGLTLAVSFLIGVILPKILIICGVGATTAATIVYVVKLFWKSRALIKIIYNFIKTPNKTVWTYVGVVIHCACVFAPDIFKAVWPAGYQAMNEWLFSLLKKLGGGLADAVTSVYEANKDLLGGWYKEIGEKAKDWIDPNACKNYVLKILNNNDLYRQMHNAGKSLGEYINAVVNDLGLDKASADALKSFMTQFNNITYSGEEVYKHLWGQLHGCKFIQIGFDTNFAKKFFNNTGNIWKSTDEFCKWFTEKLAIELKKQGLNIDRKQLYAIVHEKVWKSSVSAASGIAGQQGGVDAMGTDIPATAENIAKVNAAIKAVIKQYCGNLPGKVFAGVLNAVDTVKEKVHEFIPDLLSNFIYWPHFRKDKKPAEEGGPAPAPTPEPKPVEIPKKLEGMMLHDVKTNKDYPIAYIIKDVQMSAVADIMPMKDIQTMLDIESKTLEMKGNTKVVQESRKEKRMKKINALKDFDWTYLNETENNSDNQGEDEVEKKEKNLIAYISQGKFTVTAFMPAKDGQPDNLDFQQKPLVVFCPYYSMIGINKQIAPETNIFPFKNFFSHYTFRCAQDKMDKLKFLLNALFFNSVLRTYEVIKFTGQKWELVEEKNGMLYPTEKSPQGEIDALGKLTVREFCAVHNGSVEAYKLYGGPLNLNQAIVPNLNRANKKFSFKSDGKNDLSKNNYEGGSANIPGAKPTMDMWHEEPDAKQSKSQHSGASFDEFKHNQDGEQPKDANGNGNVVNNTFGKRTHGQTDTQREQNPTWLENNRKNMTGQNESFDFDHNKNFQYLNENLIHSFGYDNYKALNESEYSWNEFVNDVNTVGKVVFPIIKKILKVGGKAAYKITKTLVHKTATEIRTMPKEKKIAIRNLVFVLMSLSSSFNGLETINDYNSNPIYPGTKVELKDSTLIVQNEKGQKETYKCPKVQNNQEIKQTTEQSNIPMLKKGEKAPDYYEPSDEMKKTIAEFEGFIPYIYDSANPRRKITKQDMRNPNVDLTIGYGHKLTMNDRKKFPINYKISPENAYKLFLKDLKAHTDVVNQHLKELPYYNKVKFPQGFIDGLVSIRYNSSEDLAFGRPSWIKKGDKSFWERMQLCQLDKKNGTLLKKDVDFSLAPVKKLFKPTFRKIYPGLPARRDAEYKIMIQPFGKINKQLYKQIIDSKNAK